MKSVCCEAEVFSGENDGITNFFSCSSCLEACDVVSDEDMKKAARAVYELQRPVMDQEDAEREDSQFLLNASKAREAALMKEVGSLTQKNILLKAQVRNLQRALTEHMKPSPGDDAGQGMKRP